MSISKTVSARAIGKIQQMLADRGYGIVRLHADDAHGFDQNAGTPRLKLAERLARFDAGGVFETAAERVLSQVVARFVGQARSIVCQGPGTGVFENFVAVDPSLEILGVVPDGDLLAWCRTHRAASNVEFTDREPAQLFEEVGTFDLALAIGVLDTTADFADCLRAFARLSERAVFTVTNRARSHEALTSPRPSDPHHVREWTAGEYYWVLRAFYRVVDLYAMPDPHVPDLERVGLFSEMSPLIAVCER